jgi:hypothetical protein
MNRVRSEQSIGKTAQEFLERVLGDTAQTHYHFQRRAD